jgi:hypothetical protein
MTKKFGMRWAMAGCLALGLATMAQAQGPRPGGFGQGGFGQGGPGGGSDPFGLVSNSAVRKELEIDEDQAKELSEMRAAMEREVQAAREKIAAQYSEKMNGILLPHQTDRLVGISIQLRGAAALQDPVVAKKIGLSESQQKELTAKSEALSQKAREMFQRGEGEQPNREEMQARFEEIRKEREGIIAQVLTSDQQKQLEELKGAEFDRSQMFQGFRRGGEGGEGNRGPGGRRPGGNDND